MSIQSSVWQLNLQWSQRAVRMSWVELQWKLLLFWTLLSRTSWKLLLGDLQLETTWRRKTLKSSTMMFLQRLDLAHWTVITVSQSVQQRCTAATTTASFGAIPVFLQWFLLVAKDVEDIYEDIQPANEQRSNGWSSNEFESCDDGSDDDAAPPASRNSQVSQWSSTTVWRSAAASAQVWTRIKGCRLRVQFARAPPPH